MPFSANAALKPISMATNACVVSVPSLFASSKACLLPAQLKPVKLCCSYATSIAIPYLFPRKRDEPFMRVSVFSAQQEEDNTVLVEEEEEEEQIEGNFDWGVSENEVEAQESDEALGGAGDSEEVPSEEAKVYVGNLPYDIDSEGLAKIFEEAGIVEIAEVIYNRDTDQSRGFGFVTMGTVDEAERAVEMFHRYEVIGRSLTVNKAAPRGSRPERAPRVFETSCRIYVGNLPWSVDDARLEQIFSEHGKVVSARVVSDRESGRSRGFGFVVMSSESEMNDAIANLDGQSLDGRAIRVNVAEDRQPRRSRF